MRYKFFFSTLAIIILGACSTIPAEDDLIDSIVETSTPQIISKPTKMPIETSTPLITHKPTETLTETPTPTIAYAYMLETPFWVSYDGVFTLTPSADYHQSTRDDFKEMDIDQGMGANVWMLPFKDDFDLAVSKQLDWIEYPEQIALRISGYPNPDYSVPEEIERYQPNQDVVVVMVTDWNIGDDSIFAYQYRVEMSKVNNYWIVDWLGIRWQCRRGHEDWGITLCV